MQSCRNFYLFVLLISVRALAGSTVPWSSEEGMRRMARAEYKADFFRLAPHFQSQKDKMTCGPVSGVIVLNAFRRHNARAPLEDLCAEFVRTEATADYDARLPLYTLDVFFTPAVREIKTLEQIFGAPHDGKARYGLELGHLHRMLEAHSLHSELRVAAVTLTESTIREEWTRNLQDPDDFVLVNFKRSVLEQPGGGHFSPLGAYDSVSDSVLVMDVNPTTLGWYWVDVPLLISAMQTLDVTQNRGYLHVRER